MRRNRFEQVDDIQDDAITFELSPDGDADKARVHVPQGGDDNLNTSEPIAKIDAFRGAIKLANTLKLPIVVMGDDSAWDKTWGDLFRPI
ncbi:MAG: hypothetical protein AAGJ94_14115 [Pseudomonadota bacterium]